MHEGRPATHWFWHEQTYQTITKDVQAMVTCSPAMYTKNPPPPCIKANQSHNVSFKNDQPNHEKPCSIEWQTHAGYLPSCLQDLASVQTWSSRSPCCTHCTTSSWKLRSAVTDAQALVTCRPAMHTKNPPPPCIKANESHNASVFKTDQTNNHKHAMKPAFKT